MTRFDKERAKAIRKVKREILAKEFDEGWIDWGKYVADHPFKGTTTALGIGIAVGKAVRATAMPLPVRLVAAVGSGLIMPAAFGIRNVIRTNRNLNAVLESLSALFLSRKIYTHFNETCWIGC